MLTTLTLEFLRKPLTTGAICPSSKYLARQMVSCIGLEHAHTIVELGPGTGAITKTILEHKPEDSTFFAIELNKTVCDVFRKLFPGQIIYNESASDLPRLLEQTGQTHADVILSGLPWASFPNWLQDEILNAILVSLPEGGSFATFAYLQGMLLPAGIRFRKKLNSFFRKVETSPVVWRNIPPAFVYRCHK